MGARARKSVKKEILEKMQIAGTDRKLSAKKWLAVNLAVFICIKTN